MRVGQACGTIMVWMLLRRLRLADPLPHLEKRQTADDRDPESARRRLPSRPQQAGTVPAGVDPVRARCGGLDRFERGEGAVTC
jgi:hypothetical protein